MIYKPKGRRFYCIKFRFEGRLIHRRTKHVTAAAARIAESKMRTELANGNFGILAPKPPAPTLRDFLKDDFLPFVEVKHAAKPKTVEHYKYGAQKLTSSDLAGLRLSEISDQHAAQYASRLTHLAPSTINCGLRTLRRCLALARDWGKLQNVSRISLARDERQRDRVLTAAEWRKYEMLCKQPWRTIATMMYWVGIRPSEAYALRWDNVYLDSGLAGNTDAYRGWFRVATGKTKAAKRNLPVFPFFYGLLRAQWEAQGQPSDGWVFPADSPSGHVGPWLYKQHNEAVRLSGVRPFVPYDLRHTALTRLAQFCDSFTLARIAGHSSITITQRYCHPQPEAIQRAFQHAFQAAGLEEVVTAGGHHSEFVLPRTVSA